jgi:hypothetical protein
MAAALTGKDRDIFCVRGVQASYSVFLWKDATMADPGRGAYDQAGVATAEAGMVMLDGPDGVAIAMTPDAAEETGHSLIAAARQARSQSTEQRPEPA